MSLNTAISGINAAQTGLNTVGNNIANSQTAGYKAQRAEFADLYANSSKGGGSTNKPGIGVKTARLATNFTNGNIKTTGNPLDVAINGGGFFAMNKNGQSLYSRDGQFQLTTQGYIENNAGARLQGYQATPSGKLSNTLSDLQVSRGAMAPKASTNAALGVNLKDTDPALNPANFNTANSSTYDRSTTFTVHDSLGTPQTMTAFFVRASGTGGANTPDNWKVFYSAKNSSGNQVASGALTTLKFNSSGALVSGASGTANVPAWGNGSAASNIKFNFNGSTLTSQSYAVNSENVNGYAPGQYQNVAISQNGTVKASYNNGQKVTLGKVALASFQDKQGLKPTSGNSFLATQKSGNALINAPGKGGTGALQGGAVEQSNVSLSKSLVSLISDQQAYQANTQSISTGKQDIRKLLTI